MNKLIKEFINDCNNFISRLETFNVFNLEEEAIDLESLEVLLVNAEDKLDEIIYSSLQDDSPLVLCWKSGYSETISKKHREVLKDFKIVKNKLRIMVGDAEDIEITNLKDKAFISHSSKDIKFVEILAKFLNNMGIKNIFCSSIEGQGVKNGKKIEEFVRNEIIEDKVLIYIITKNFLDSSYCAHELGAGWILRDKRLQDKSLRLIKLPDVEFNDIIGFIDKGDKMTELAEDSFTTFVEELEILFNLAGKKPSEYKKLFDEFFINASEIIKNLKTKATQTKQERQKESKEKQKEIIQKFNKAEKEIIACMYFSDSRTTTLNITDALTNLMETKGVIGRGATISRGGYNFSYFLQQWVIDYIEENIKFKNELKNIQETNSFYKHCR